MREVVTFPPGQPDMSGFLSAGLSAEMQDGRCGMVATLCDARPSVFLIGDEAACATLVARVANAGGRMLGIVPFDEATAQLDRIADVDLIIMECRTESAVQPTLLARLDTMARMDGIALVIVTRLAELDEVAAHAGHATALLCDPDETELAAAIAAGLEARMRAPQLRDIGKDGEDNRLERLSEEVSRLARTLDALTGYGMVRPAPAGWPTGPHERAPGHADGHLLGDRNAGYAAQPGPEAFAGRPREALRAGEVRDLLRMRRMRDQYLPADLFADPAWDMLLDLMAARLSGERVSVSSLCIAAAVPPTTALRWIRQLTDRGIFRREADPTDGRRIFIALSDEAAAGIEHWFATRRRIMGVGPGRGGELGA